MKQAMFIPNHNTLMSEYKATLNEFMQSGFPIAVMDEEEQRDRFSHGFSLRGRSFHADLVANNLRASVCNYRFPIKVYKRGKNIYLQRIDEII